MAMRVKEGCEACCDLLTMACQEKGIDALRLDSRLYQAVYEGDTVSSNSKHPGTYQVLDMEYDRVDKVFTYSACCGHAAQFEYVESSGL